MIFHLRDAGAGGVPFLFDLPLANFQPEFFSAQAFELQQQLFALLRECSSFITDRSCLHLEGGFTPLEFRAFLSKARGKGFGGGKALVYGGMLGTCRGERGVLGMDGATELHKLFGEARAFGLGFGAAEGCGVMLVPGALGALPGGLHVRANTSEFVLAD